MSGWRTRAGRWLSSPKPNGRRFLREAPPASFRRGSEVDVGRLKSLPRRLGGLPSRVKAQPKVADRFYRSADWKALRAAKRAEGPAFCCVCGAGGKLILDHRHERNDGGADLPPLDQLDWYCVGHHNAKTARERAARARGER